MKCMLGTLDYNDSPTDAFVCLRRCCGDENCKYRRVVEVERKKKVDARFKIQIGGRWTDGAYKLS